MDASARSPGISGWIRAPSRLARIVKTLAAMRLTALFLFVFVFGTATAIVLDKTGLMPILTSEVRSQLARVGAL
jgi:hypothetical protein